MINLINADIVTCFNTVSIGTKVLDHKNFLMAAKAAIADHDFTADPVPGQGFIQCPAAIPCVSAGVGKRTNDPEDYVLRFYRGQVEMFLWRENAAPVEGCALVVYTKEAYLADPDVAGDQAEVERVKDATHVLVAVLAFAGPKAPLSPHRLVHNLAGGNKEAAAWTADEIRVKALETKTYHDDWCTVAD